LCIYDSRPATHGNRCDVCWEKHQAKKALKKNGKELTAKEKDDIETHIQKKFEGAGLTITTKSLHIQTLEDLLTESQVDLDVWEVVGHEINSWEVTIGRRGGGQPQTFTNYQVKAKFQKLVPDPMDTAIRQLIKDITPYQVPLVDVPINEDTDFAMEMALYDAHFGKLAWGPETEQGSYDMEIAAHTFVNAARKNLDFCSPWNLSKIFFPFGQDFMHIENYQGTTPMAKHVLDTDTRLPKILQTAIEAMFDVVKLCRDVAPVEVLWVPGNHDMHSSFYLSEIIKQRFRDDDRVLVDNTPPWRKARLWGNLLVGFTHDANVRQANVVNMLPQFFPELWGQSKYREWHTGHKHKKMEWKFAPVASAGGTVIRQIPTLSPIDAWHYQEGFVDAIPAGESFIWSKQNGVIAHFTAYCGTHSKGA
jgi:hypothetical protein